MGPPAKKMDKSKALGLMGFSTSRSIEAAEGPKATRALLDKALFEKTQEILHRSANAKQANKPGGKAGAGAKKKSATSSPGSSKKEIADDTLQLHEAYQFLLRKYVPSDCKKRTESTDEPEVDSAIDFSHLKD